MIIPPLKTHGIKTKIVPFIRRHVYHQNIKGKVWVEPFCGTCVVGFNVAGKYAVFADTNKHIVEFYTAIKMGEVTPLSVERYLIGANARLQKDGDEYYYSVRESFNVMPTPHAFLFLNRACFNGVMRFNQQGGFNVPFCKNVNKFTDVHIGKIVRMVADVQYILDRNRWWQFKHADYVDTIKTYTQKDAFVYCDPPYVGKHGYGTAWGVSADQNLRRELDKSGVSYLVSGWLRTELTMNDANYIWAAPHLRRQEIVHSYKVGPTPVTRGRVVETLVSNYSPHLHTVPEEAAYAPNV